MTDVVGVVGCGTMGAGIAEACARAGHRVVVAVRDDARAGAGRRRIEESLGRAVDSGRVDAAGRDEALARIGFVTDLGSLEEARIVVETVPELLEAKREVFRGLGAACPEAILATNTSSLPVVELAAASGRADRVVGLHFFNPAPAMPLVELAVTVATDPQVGDAAAAFARSLDKTVVVCRDRAGFIANLLLFPYLNEAVRLLDAGAATRDDIDTAMRLGAGHPMGPLELVDLIGLDACEQILQSLHRQFAEPRFAPAPALRELVAAGYTGRKAGRGFYDHTSDSRPGGVRAAAPEGVDVESLGVVGTGTVATGLAEAAAVAGLPIVGLGRSADSCERGRAAGEASAARSVEKGRLEPDARREALARIRWTTEPADLAGCGFVVEAVTEDLAAKREVFTTLDAVADADAVLATATSSLPVVRLAAATRRPDRVLGFHVFNPVPAMRLVELVRTVATSDAAVARAEAVAARLGKTVVHCRDRAGFIVNRLLFPYLNDAARMVEEGYASVEDVDTVMTLGCRHPLGPMRLMDLVGLDVTVEILRSLQAEHLDPAYAPVPLLEEMVAAGFLGRKSGRGFATR